MLIRIESCNECPAGKFREQPTYNNHGGMRSNNTPFLFCELGIPKWREHARHFPIPKWCPLRELEIVAKESFIYSYGDGELKHQALHEADD